MSLLDSLTQEVRAFIKRVEQQHAQGVLGDFEDALRNSDNKIRTAYRWLWMYRRASRND